MQMDTRERLRRVRHVKRGTTYRVLGLAQVQAPDDAPLTDYEVVTVYQSEQDGEFWVRRHPEFEDGRFEDLPPAEPAVNAYPALVGALESASTALWRHGENGLAREIDTLLDKVSPESRDKIDAALSARGDGS